MDSIFLGQRGLPDVSGGPWIAEWVQCYWILTGELFIFKSPVEKHASIDGEVDWQISKSQDKNWQR